MTTSTKERYTTANERLEEVLLFARSRHILDIDIVEDTIQAIRAHEEEQSRRIAELERERDDLRRKLIEMDRICQFTEKGIADLLPAIEALERERDELRRRIERAQKIMIQRQWKHPGKWPVMDASDDTDKIRLFLKCAHPDQTRCEWIHAVPVEAETVHPDLHLRSGD